MTPEPTLAAVPDIATPVPPEPEKPKRAVKPPASSPLVKRRIDIDKDILDTWSGLLANLNEAQVAAQPVVAQIGGVVSALRDAAGIARASAAGDAGVAEHRLAKIEGGETATIDETVALFGWVKATAEKVSE